MGHILAAVVVGVREKFDHSSASESSVAVPKGLTSCGPELHPFVIEVSVASILILFHTVDGQCYSQRNVLIPVHPLECLLWFPCTSLAVGVEILRHATEMYIYRNIIYG